MLRNLSAKTSEVIRRALEAALEIREDHEPECDDLEGLEHEENDLHAECESYRFLLKKFKAPERIVLDEDESSWLDVGLGIYRPCLHPEYDDCPGDIEEVAVLESFRTKLRELGGRHEVRRSNLTERLKQAISGAKHRAKKNGVRCHITIEDLREIWTLQGGLCALTGLPMLLRESPVYGEPDPKGPSIDRIDGNKGYVRGNVRFLQYQINVMRGAYSDAEFFASCLILANKMITRQEHIAGVQ